EVDREAVPAVTASSTTPRSGTRGHGLRGIGVAEIDRGRITETVREDPHRVVVRGERVHPGPELEHRLRRRRRNMEVGRPREGHSPLADSLRHRPVQDRPDARSAPARIRPDVRGRTTLPAGDQEPAGRAGIESLLEVAAGAEVLGDESEGPLVVIRGEADLLDPDGEGDDALLRRNTRELTGGRIDAEPRRVRPVDQAVGEVSVS